MDDILGIDMTNQTISYMPDLSKIALDEYKKELRNGRLLPSRKSLLGCLICLI